RGDFVRAQVVGIVRSEVTELESVEKARGLKHRSEHVADALCEAVLVRYGRVERDVALRLGGGERPPKCPLPERSDERACTRVDARRIGCTGHQGGHVPERL